MKYRADIDGLRAIAIIPVVLYHNEINLFSGGFVGVDIFFVISGYLITLIVQDEIEQSRFSIGSFYERRIRRIFPALFALIVLCSIYAATHMLPWAFSDFGKSIVAATLFVANIHFWKETDYFAAAADTKPLLHTWSLSVEEQFYLIFPLILLWLYRKRRRRWKSLLLPIALSSLLVSMWGVHHYPSATFYLIPTRAWELLLGAFLALGLFPQIEGRAVREATAAIGLMMILSAVFMFSQTTPFPGEYALIPCIGSALIIYAGREGTSFVGRLLSARPMVFVGLISYSLYLWHWPIIVFARQLSYEADGAVNTISIVMVSLVMAVLSWRFVEQPFRKKGILLERKIVIVAAASIMAVSVVTGYVIHATKGWPGRFGEEPVLVDFDRRKYNLGTCFLKDSQHYSEWKGDSCLLQTDKKFNTLLWGDSFAAHYVPGIKRYLTHIDSNILQYTASGCAPAFEYDPVDRKQCKSFTSHVERIVIEKKIRTVVLSAAWALALKNGLTYSSIIETVERLRNKGIDVYVIGQSPRFDDGVQNINYYSILRGTPVSEDMVSIELKAINSRLRGIAGNDKFVDPSEFFCVNLRCRFKGEEGFYFWDDGHFTSYGSEQAVKYVLSKMKL